MLKPYLRCLALCVLLVLSVVMISSCKSVGNREQYDSAQELAQILVEKLNMENVTKVSGDKLIVHYNIPNDLFNDAIAYLSENEDVTDQVAVFSLKHNSDRAQVYNEISSRLSNLSNSYKDYSPVEYKKISNAVIKILDNDLIFIICDNPSLASEILFKMGAEDYYIKGE